MRYHRFFKYMALAGISFMSSCKDAPNTPEEQIAIVTKDWALLHKPGLPPTDLSAQYYDVVQYNGYYKSQPAVLRSKGELLNSGIDSMSIRNQQVVRISDTVFISQFTRILHNKEKQEKAPMYLRWTRGDNRWLIVEEEDTADQEVRQKRQAKAMSIAAAVNDSSKTTLNAVSDKAVNFYIIQPELRRDDKGVTSCKGKCATYLGFDQPYFAPIMLNGWAGARALKIRGDLSRDLLFVLERGQDAQGFSKFAIYDSLAPDLPLVTGTLQGPAAKARTTSLTQLTNQDIRITFSVENEMSASKKEDDSVFGLGRTYLLQYNQGTWSNTPVMEGTSPIEVAEQ